MNWAGFESGRGPVLDIVHYSLPPDVELWELYLHSPIRLYDVAQARLQFYNFCDCMLYS
jgi:hypothetical protein